MIKSSLILSVSLLVAMVAHADDRSTTTNSPPSVPSASAVLVSVGDINPALLKRISVHISNECKIPVRIAERSLTLAGSVAQQAKAIASLRSPDIWAIGLIHAPEHVATFQSGVFSSLGVTLFNVDLLRGAEQEEPLWSEAHQRRVIKQTMRSWGLLMGLKNCPNPRCCLKHCRSLHEVDSKGADFCPPCQRSVDAVIRALKRGDGKSSS